MKLQGEHLTLRPPMQTDAEHVLAWENDPAVAALSSHEGQLSLSDIQDYISGITDIYLDKQLRWIITRGHELLGTLDLFDVDFDEQRAKLGILIAKESQRRAGAGKEAIDLVINYCKEVLILSTVIADVQTDNQASIAFFEQLGFVEKQRAKDIIRYHLKIN